MDKEYSVLVTGIGGNVGQGILRNIQNSGINIRTIGTNVVAFTAGNHLVNKNYLVPYAHEEGYISTILDIVQKERIDLIIPSTDNESYFLALNSALIPCKIASSEALVCEAYCDKYLTHLRHSQHSIPFVDSCLPSQYEKGRWAESIAKPRKGRGSRGLVINPESLERFSDDEYLVQEYVEGPEITTAFYVTQRGELHGHITMLRSLENGTTVGCEVTFDFDAQLIPIMQKMISAGGLRGAVNIQSRINSIGKVVPFEINCRVSGTNSIRSQLGFPDVKYILQEHLLNQEPDQPKVIKGRAMRILMDIIFPEFDADPATINSNTTHKIY